MYLYICIHVLCGVCFNRVYNGSLLAGNVSNNETRRFQYKLTNTHPSIPTKEMCDNVKCTYVYIDK